MVTVVTVLKLYCCFPTVIVVKLQLGLLFETLTTQLLTFLSLPLSSQQVGTENDPFMHKGIITLHGHLRALEMPIYGAKTLGVRNGTLDLHGNAAKNNISRHNKYVQVHFVCNTGIPRKSWTQLAETAHRGDRQLKLQHSVDWKPGDQIVLASTGKRHSQRENEQLVIDNVCEHLSFHNIYCSHMD